VQEKHVRLGAQAKENSAKKKKANIVDSRVRRKLGKGVCSFCCFLDRNQTVAFVASQIESKSDCSLCCFSDGRQVKCLVFQFSDIKTRD
jgi:hypothetical protein